MKSGQFKDYILSENPIYIFVFFSIYLGDCDHLEPYPVYLKIQHNINLTIWDKAWPPEIDFLDSYVNLSSYHPIVLDGLTVGHRISKNAKYFANSEWGCIMMFPMDLDLADDYYLMHHSDTNSTMLKCYSIWFGDLKRHYQFSHWSYVFSSHLPVWQRINLIASALITVTGVFGECFKILMCLVQPTINPRLP